MNGIITKGHLGIALKMSGAIPRQIVKNLINRIGCPFGDTLLLWMFTKIIKSGHSEGESFATEESHLARWRCFATLSMTGVFSQALRVCEFIRFCHPERLNGNEKPVALGYLPAVQASEGSHISVGRCFAMQMLRYAQHDRLFIHNLSA